jgi:hypothetical protein
VALSLNSSIVVAFGLVAGDGQRIRVYAIARKRFTAQPS